MLKMSDEYRVGDVVYIVEDFKATIDFFKCEIIDKIGDEITIKTFHPKENTKSRSLYLNQTNRFITKNKMFAFYVYLAFLLRYSDIPTLENNSFLLTKIKDSLGITDISTIKNIINESTLQFPEKWI